MRWVIIAGIIACVSGCASDADDPPPTPQAASKPCAVAAQSRAYYAGVNGYNARDQRIVFRYVYAECVKWEAKGYEPPSP